MSHLKGSLKRVFTQKLEEDKSLSVYDLFNWKTVDVFMKNWKTGKVIADMPELEFPENYSQNACNIIATKYFRKAGVNNALGYERSMKEVAHRLVKFWSDSLKDEGIIKTSSDYQIVYDELVFGLLAQMWAPNSPQWFNTGMFNSYGIKGEKDNLFYYDQEKKEVVESPDRYTRTQASACFILSIEDKLMGDHSITEQYVSETKLFKGGSGVGTNFSNIRGLDERLSSGGHSSGMMSFLQGLDKNAGAIKSGGTTRRAAKMVIADIDHPEIETFITWKAREEKKVRDLGKMGYDTSMDGEAYSTVGGQNSNNSVRLNKSFMESVFDLDKDPDAEITLKGRVDQSINKNAKVSTLWNLINKSSWECADPGLQFDDIFNAWHTCPGGEDGDVNAKYNRINATNPCSEYAFLDDTACNLASINVYKFYNEENNEFKIDEYVHLIEMIQLVLESSIHWGQFPTKDIARKSHLFRTTGLGLANTSSLLLALGLPYDSDESRNLVAALSGIMTGASYRMSSFMAETVGPFEKFDINKDHMLRVIRNHSRVAGAMDDELEEIHYDVQKIDHDVLKAAGLGKLGEELKKVWKDAYAFGEKFGYRNAQVSVIAPTGTISLAMDCGATSIEPFYSHIVFKQLVGGGNMEMVNPILEIALKNLEYNENAIEEIIAYIIEKDEDGKVLHGGVIGAPHLKEEHYPIFDTANTISPEGHVMMVSAITPLISGSVSKTVNLPNNATVEDINKIHKLAWKTGTKAIALYRDGCKASQPLTSGVSEDKERKLQDYSYSELLDYAKNCVKHVPNRKRPGGMRTSRTHSAKIGDIELYITIGFYEDGNLAEVFVSTDKEGTVVKGLLASLSKALSNMLQYNIPPKEISRLLRGQQFEPAGFVARHPYIKYASSISDLVSKIIDIEMGDFSRCQVKPENFTPMSKASIHVVGKPATGTDVKEVEAEGERIYGETCSHCGSTRMMKNGTCKVCLDCGSTTGCS
ncbi:vitamin B12-dependent ribonucleotide reductase [Alkalibacter mobilis]|uniref:vitamin B12-dependent ribonucleotide reductase n=1 Tax=Alkalibacter mobilis TaxID=2787712 RepID=UPI00189DCC70|nr:vitamin B12-dependent ribonucleotide reductase [Alkalibacter mobilis]MBF7096524.1 vitamin B12-dependent ribonucleotide reductase [Alkalibacter mobilis]